MLKNRCLYMDCLSKEQRHRNMSNIKSANTTIECILRKELRRRGYGYRKNYKALPGTPDIVLTKYRIAIFCDSEFFHGKNWDEQKKRISTGNNPDFWIKKIEGNIERDERVNNELTHLGWRVIRFWGNDIKKNVAKCVDEIDDAVLEVVTEKVCDEFIGNE